MGEAESLLKHWSHLRLFISRYNDLKMVSLIISQYLLSVSYILCIRKNKTKNSVAQSCLIHSNSMNCSSPGFPVQHQLPELAQTCQSSWWYHPTISSSIVPFSSCLQSSPAIGSFPRSQFFASGGQSIGVSASTSVLPMNIQDWFLLKFTGWISLQSKGLSKVLSNIKVQKHQFFSTQLSLVQLSHTYISLIRRTFVSKVMPLLFNMLSRLGIAFLQGASIF